MFDGLKPHLLPNMPRRCRHRETTTTSTTHTAGQKRTAKPSRGAPQAQSCTDLKSCCAITPANENQQDPTTKNSSTTRGLPMAWFQQSKYATAPQAQRNLNSRHDAHRRQNDQGKTKRRRTAGTEPHCLKCLLCHYACR